MRSPDRMTSPMRQHPALVFAVVFAAIFVLHVPLLSLPYFWDEAGYYVPAARDLLLTGSLIPHTTVSNAHPPLVMAWLALWWKCIGYAPAVTRSAMLFVAAFSLTGLFRLAESVSNTRVAIASTTCATLYPVFFAQSSLAQVDLAAAGLTFWGLCAWFEQRPLKIAVWFSLAALAKETAILSPLALAIWIGAGWIISPDSAFSRLWSREDSTAGPKARRIFPLLAPVLPLLLWYLYHYIRTGYVFGNPEFFRYNVAATLNPLRFLLALCLRLWQVFGYLHLWLLTLGMMLAMLLPPLKDKDHDVPRGHIPVPAQMIFLVIVVTYVVAMALIGGAVLARYMLPVVPLVILVGVSTLWRRLRYWTAAASAIAIVFVLAWFWNPPYGFAPEDNLAYRDYVVMHQRAETLLEARYPMAHVLTAWPASDELSRPWLGYVTRPMQVVRIEDFSLEQMLSAADYSGHFEAALVFSTKDEPAHSLSERWSAWRELKQKFFGFHQDLPPALAAKILGGRVVYSEERQGQWVAVIEIQRSEIENAALHRSAGFQLP